MIRGVDVEKLRAEVLALPIQERAELVYALLRSLHGDDGPEVEAV